MAEVITPSIPNTELTDRFIDSTLVPNNKPFAGGASEVNNHVDGGYEEVKDLGLREAVVKQAAGFILSSGVEFDCIAPVPNGATGWAYAIVRELQDPELLVLESAKIRNRLFQATKFGELQYQSLINRYSRPKALVLDDVTSDGGTNEAMADYLTDLGLEVSLVMSLLFRGDIGRLQQADRKYKRSILMQREIPHLIDWAKRDAHPHTIKPLDLT
jgi:orotate phosphoribosyltransferase